MTDTGNAPERRLLRLIQAEIDRTGPIVIMVLKCRRLTGLGKRRWSTTIRKCRTGSYGAKASFPPGRWGKAICWWKGITWKCIYIDPPYNTGNEKWAYNDNVNSPEIRKWLDQTVGRESEDLSRHDKWLCMMYPRLILLRDFLRVDGAIFISIDDNEFSNLRIIMDEIYPKAMTSYCFLQKTPKNGALI